MGKVTLKTVLKNERIVKDNDLRKKDRLLV
jgi:hypothetical protein